MLVRKCTGKAVEVYCKKCVHASHPIAALDAAFAQTLPSKKSKKGSDVDFFLNGTYFIWVGATPPDPPQPCLWDQNQISGHSLNGVACWVATVTSWCSHQILQKTK